MLSLFGTGFKVDEHTRTYSKRHNWFVMMHTHGGFNGAYSESLRTASTFAKSVWKVIQGLGTHKGACKEGVPGLWWCTLMVTLMWLISYSESSMMVSTLEELVWKRMQCLWTYKVTFEET